jgi:bzd-type benzoyl-CoA reductase N subunit
MLSTSESPALTALIDAHDAPLSDWPANFPGYQAMGYLCSYVPEEIIHAAGFVPLRMRGSTAPLRQVDAHLQSFTCALCRSTLDQVLGGDLDFLAGTIFAHTCDTMQAQADLWRLNTDASHFLDTVMQPANLGSPSAAPYLESELNRFRQALAEFAGQPISDENLRASIALFDETRRQITELGEYRDCLSSPDFFAVLDVAQAMPRQVFNPLLAELLATLHQGAACQEHRDRPGGPRIFLVGAVLDEPRILHLIEDLGARIVGDDLCSGSRHFHDQVDTEGDPIANLARYYLRRPPCPTKYHPTHDPSRHLMDQVQSARADGIVFVLEKFCEPHAFDYALVRPTLEQIEMPSLLLEMEQVPSLEALRTRLQAFVEMI